MRAALLSLAIVDPQRRSATKKREMAVRRPTDGRRINSQSRGRVRAKSFFFVFQVRPTACVKCEPKACCSFTCMVQPL